MDKPDFTGSGDPGWIRAHADLLALHTEKSATYGTDGDRLANFTKLGEAANQPPERYAVERLIEKAIRALHMIDAGEAEAVKEYPDLASLALCAEALRKRPLHPANLGEVECEHRSEHFDRGSMHYFCDDCGAQTTPCMDGTYIEARCIP